MREPGMGDLVNPTECPRCHRKPALVSWRHDKRNDQYWFTFRCCLESGFYLEGFEIRRRQVLQQHRLF